MNQINIAITVPDDFEQKDLEALASAVMFVLKENLVEGAMYAGKDAEGQRREGYVPSVSFDVTVSE